MLKEAQECSICLSESDDNHILCSGNHIYCIDCLNVHYDTMIKNDNINNKCTICKTDFFENKIDALLNDNIKVEIAKRDVFNRFCIPENLKVMACPVCSSNEGIFLIEEKDYIQFYYCDTCNKSVCLYCLKECLNKSDHLNCSVYHKIALDLEKLIEFAYQKKCHECRKIKRSNYEAPNFKDSSCTHIKCPMCNMNTCYICQGHEQIVNKSDSSSSPIYRHNDDWKINDQRCPMYIRYFSEIIPDWPKDEYLAGVKLYEYKIKLYLKKINDKFGFEKVKSAYNQFRDKRLESISDEAFKEGFTTFIQYPQIDNKLLQFFKI